MPQIWTPPQRRVLLALLLLLIIVLSIRYTMNPVYVSDPPPVDPPRLNELANGIDPNTADESALAALPIIGPSRARDIIVFRTEFTSAHPGITPFQRPEDLTRVKGIGPATVDSLKSYLVFTESPAQ